jgi:tetratricopeptide (TPR) repeat protein
MGKLQQDVGVLNEGDVLREHISASEKALASITPGSARELLQNTADAHRLKDALRASGADVRAEESRLETIEERMVKSARPIVTALGGSAQFASVRKQIDPTITDKWWQLDEVVADERRKQWQRIGIGVAIIALIGLAGFLLRDVLFPDDPVGDAVFAAQSALRDGDGPRAVSAIDLGLTNVPTSTTLLIWKAALLEQQQQSGATSVYGQAQAMMPERDFVLEKSQVNLMLGNFEQVITDTTRLINAYPDLAEAYFIRASGHESRNDSAQAIQDLEQAARIAEAAGNDTLYATARVRLGMLMQNAGAGLQQP